MDKLFWLILVVFIIKFYINKLKMDMVLEMWDKNKSTIPPGVKIKYDWYQYKYNNESFRRNSDFLDSLLIYIDAEWKKRGFLGILAELNAKKI